MWLVVMAIWKYFMSQLILSSILLRLGPVFPVPPRRPLGLHDFTHSACGNDLRVAEEFRPLRCLS